MRIILQLIGDDLSQQRGKSIGLLFKFVIIYI